MAWKNKSDVVLTLMCSLYSAQFGREVDEKGRKLLRGKEKDESKSFEKATYKL